MATPSMIMPEVWSYDFGPKHPIDHNYSPSSGSVVAIESVDSDIEPLSLPPPMIPVPSSGPQPTQPTKQTGKKRKQWAMIKRLLASARGHWHHAHGKRADRAAQSFKDRRRWDEESEAWCMYMPNVMQRGSDEDVDQACQDLLQHLRERA